MVIEYGCVRLRAVEKEDFDLLFYLINSPKIENTVMGWNFPISRMAHTQWLETFKNTMQCIRLMIELTNSKTIGMMILNQIDWKNRTAELGCKTFASLEDRIKGDTLDAVNGMLKFAFDELGMNCITAPTQETNLPALNLLRKAGFVEEGILRNRLYKSGKFINVISTSMLREEFVQRELSKLSDS